MNEQPRWVRWLALAVVLAGVIALIVAKDDEADEGPALTKAELQAWLEDRSTDQTQADPRCVLDPLWEAGLTDAELRELLEVEGTELPSRADVYVAIRDECNATKLAGECAAGDRPLIECGGLDHPDASRADPPPPAQTRSPAGTSPPG